MHVAIRPLAVRSLHTPYTPRRCLTRRPQPYSPYPAFFTASFSTGSALLFLHPIPLQLGTRVKGRRAVCRGE